LVSSNCSAIFKLSSLFLETEFLENLSAAQLKEEMLIQPVDLIAN
jgi:hypothetical protein